MSFQLNPIKRVYLIGSLRLESIRVLAQEMRALGVEVFDDWHSAGPHADDIWRDYEKQRGRSFIEALRGEHARDVFNFDKRNIDKCDTGILVLPAGKSGHMELGYMIGEKKRGYILLDDDPDRWDIMYGFANNVFATKLDLFDELKRNIR